nr:hypothetical protein [Tanacetum cinerariifolium]
MVRQKAILDLALQFDNACTAKDNLRKAYEKCNDIPQEIRALINTFLKEGSDKDYYHTCFNTPSTQHPVRIIPSPAGIVQAVKLLKQKDILLGLDGVVRSTQEYIKKVVEDIGEDDDFKSGSWVNATDYVNANGGTVSGCLEDIKNFLKNEKLDQVVAIVKSCSSNVIGDLTVTMKDLSGTIPRTIHHKVISEGGYEKEITLLLVLLMFLLMPLHLEVVVDALSQPRYGVSVPTLTTDYEGNKNSSYLGLRKKSRLSLKNDMLSRDNPKIEDKDHFELKGQFFKDLRENTFNGSNHEDANEHIEKVLKIVDLFHVPNINEDQLMLRVFPISLIGAACHWLRNEPTGSIKT